ncbi:M20/M25/M40 family metallo-hydrolase [Microterricola viridarii]|uniref:Peptidase M20 family protein n=1 Tax=Microterricola viridarii TaxID=412690 RepID=A0A0X8E3R5_9MICO|nr:M20/M25/M40 family metallo-hydrolase [Microterricola viridarii]AMB58858.1 peptidase M20 family protein [Microterricola viridarii]
MNSAHAPGLDGAAEFDFLRELVAIESPSLDRAASERVAAPIAERLSAVGGRVRLARTEAGTSIVADFAGPGHPLLLVGHTDTVWPVGTLESSLPWSHENGIIRGPGTYDMKSGIVVICAALQRLDGNPSRAVRVVLNCDEEVGSPTTGELIRAQAADAMAAIGFESPHPDGALKVGRRGSTRLAVHAHGRAAHAALNPELGVSAIDELIDQLAGIREITEDPLLPSAVLCNVGVISGGTRANVVPESARAEIGLRFVDSETESRVLSAIRGIVPRRRSARIEVETLSSRPAWRASAADAALLAQLSATAALLGQRLDGRPAAGAGDTNILGSVGVPTVDGFGPLGGGAHAIDEHIVAASLHQRIDLLSAVLATPPVQP